MILDNLRVGEADVAISRPSHVPGVHQGNKPSWFMRRKAGMKRGGGLEARGVADRSTGICPEDRQPIDPRMPNISPP